MAAFKEWVQSEGLETSGKIDQFRKSCIAFDAEDYLDTLLTATLSREPLLPALGGLPFALQKHIDDDLQRFRDAEIKPIFVFNGLQAASKDGTMVAREGKRAAKILDEAWGIYDQGRGEDAVNAFGKACTYKIQHISRWLSAHLHKAGVTALTAPYSAAPQLVYMQQQGFCDGIAGSAACLVFGSERVITSIAWDSGVVSWVESAACQGRLMFSAEGFADLMLLSGCVPTLLPAYAEAEGELPHIQALRGILTQMRGDGYALLLQRQQQHKDEEYLDAFRKARFAIKHSVYTKIDGTVETRDAARAPGDVHLFTGQRLPDEIYYYLLRGVAGARILNWSAHRHITETPPLDGGNSHSYQDLVQNRLVDLRVKALAVLAVNLNRYFQHGVFHAAYWFNDAKSQLSVREGIEPVKGLMSKWHVPEAVLPDALASHPLAEALGLLADEKSAKSTVTERPNGAPGILEKPVELLGNAVLRALHDAGYMYADHTLSASGKAIQAAFKEARSNGYIEMGVTETEAEEAILVAFELLKLKVLNNQHMFPTPPYSGPPLRGNDADKDNTLLVSRVACLGFFSHREIGYTGPLSRHLLAYQQMATAVRESLRDLLEMHACAMLMSGSVSRKTIGDKELRDLGTSLPFTREPDLGLALVVKSYLDELSNEPAKRQDITRWFNYVTDMEGDLQKAWKLWACVNAGVQAAETNIIGESVKKVFRNADKWLQEKIAAAAAPNGLV
ncbi:hypothetical protein LTR91_010218 [Friedmanniomyces endolithicus]|uniref:XPG-I domain-containing protein n=1 Tax=Friedmanniomyces endolithicus TaxID=329885 RepID=A0AAN6KJH9_9PEZI|nr:hypothetical protein LTR82_010726 [Friedmanniomyces endolithicus]KAK0927491.1 hypothetical protein LTR57_003212 [Friedmanniomyces endolithicus]KAK0986503.1 hypothetical protein LTR91_010218 [Friedmanniomyces endolithicus]KAK1008032.1 hypothetical protein LTS01_002530 [Friedmanniomyces endolithicus]KAK1035920.1 hypothetical protein LTS16_014186 [Friedmanniomyces endolithicus]